MELTLCLDIWNCPFENGPAEFTSAAFGCLNWDSELAQPNSAVWVAYELHHGNVEAIPRRPAPRVVGSETFSRIPLPRLSTDSSPTQEHAARQQEGRGGGSELFGESVGGEASTEGGSKTRWLGSESGLYPFPSRLRAPSRRPPSKPSLFTSTGEEASVAGLPPPKPRRVEGGGGAVPVEVQRRPASPPPTLSDSTPPSPTLRIARPLPGMCSAAFPIFPAFQIMAHRGQLDGRSPQAAGLMRHGAFSAASLSGRQLLETSPASILEILENKLAVLTTEAEKLIRENQRLASSHVVLRQDIVETEKEMQMIRTHLGEVQVETDMHLRELVERMRLMEADIQAGDAVKKELHQVHMEAKRLITERQMLTSEIEMVTKEIQKFPVDNSNLPELVAELDGLRKEHHSLRSAFEYEKNTNIKQVEQMRTMEMNLITMTKEADKLRADVANATNRVHGAHVTAPQPGIPQAAAASAATNPYANAYANHPSAYQQGTPQAASYQQGTPQAAAYQQGTPQAAGYQQGNPQAAGYQQGTPQAAAYQQGNPQAGAYQQGNPQAGAYQQGTPQAGAYQQGTPQAGGYAYPMAYDAANAYQMHANAYAGYSGYPVASYAQPGYPGMYAAPQQPTTSAAATDATNAYGAVASTGYPAGPVQAGSGAANTGQAPPAPYPAMYDPTKGAQR